MEKKKEIKIVITSDATGAVTASKTAERQITGSFENIEKKSGSLCDRIKKHWIGISAAIAGASVAAMKAWDLMEQAAKFEQSRVAFRSMVQAMGKDATAEFEKIRKASAGLIDVASLTEAANRALSLGIPIEKLANLMEIARAKARDMGITTTQAFNDITTGIGRGSPLILDNLGLAIKLGEANEELARQLGKTVEQLTEKEKKMAVLNATTEAGREATERYNLELLNNYERMQKLTATVKNLELHIGTLLVRAMGLLVGLFHAATAGATMLARELVMPFALLEKGLNKIGIEGKLWQDTLREQDRILKESKQSMMDNFRAMVSSSEDLHKAMRPVSGSMDEMAASAGKAAGGVKKLKEETVDLNKEIKEAYMLAEKDLFDWIARDNREFNEEKLKAEEEFSDEWKRLKLSETEYELEQLKQRYEYFKKYIGESIDLEEWYAAEAQRILDKIVEKHEEVYVSGSEKAVRAFEENFNDLEGLTSRTLDGMADAFEDVFAGRSKDAFKNLCDFIKATFSRLLAEMITLALARPVIVPVVQMAQGAMGQMVPAMGGAGGGLAGLGSLGLYGGIGYGTSLLTGGSGMGGMLGGLAGYGLATSPLVTSGLASTMISAGLVGSFWGSVIPIVGTVIGGLIGSLIGDLFAGSPDFGELSLRNVAAYTNWQPGTEYGAYSGSYAGFISSDEWRRYRTSRGYMASMNLTEEGWPFSDEQLRNMAETFERVGETVRETLAEMGADVSAWYENMAQAGEDLAQIDLEGMSAEEIEKWYKNTIGRYIELASGVDFSQFQQEGETLIDTIDRVISSISAMRDTIEALNTALADLKLSEAQTMIRLSNLGASVDLAPVISGLEDAFHEIADRFMGPGTGEQKLTWLNQMIAVAEQWVAAVEESIRMQYEPAIAANEAEIATLNKQLEVLRQWQALNDTVKRTILDLTTSLSSPADVFERLGIAQAEVEKLYGLYTGSSGEARAQYGIDLEEALRNFLTVGQEAYQRPSQEYREIFDYVLGMLQVLEADSAAYAEQAADAEVRIAALTEENNRLTAMMQAELEGIQPTIMEAADWLASATEQAYGLMSYEIVNEISRVVSELANIESILTGGSAVNNPDEVPSFGVGGTMPYTGLAYLHKDERVYPPGQEPVSINISPNITINATGDAKPREIAREVESVMIESIRYGRGRAAVKEIVKSTK